MKFKWSRYIPHSPLPQQVGFLMLTCNEAIYGGAAGGGKSDALLMGGLQYFDIPGYAGIIFRKTYGDLALPGALMDRSKDWLTGKAHWSEQNKTWTSPEGGTLTFGYLDNDADIYRYQSAEFQFIGFDELTQFKARQYQYLFSRLRRLKSVDIPLRMRSASNPGGQGHEWVKQRFLIEGPTHGRPFIPAKLEDNPHLDIKEYEASLSKLDPVTRAQLRMGDWGARQEGGMFQEQWFKIIDAAPNDCRWLRYWDLAATEKNDNNEPDFTAGALVGVNLKNNIFIKDIRRLRGTPQAVEALIKQTAQLDGMGTYIYMEQEAGSSGKAVIDYYSRNVLMGYCFYGDKPSADKSTRAAPVSSQAEAGNVYLVRGPWINDFLDEAQTFPNGAHDDQVDAVSGAFSKLVVGNSFDSWDVALTAMINKQKEVT